MNILLIEDEPLIAMVAEMAFEIEGHTTKNIIGAASLSPQNLVGITPDYNDEVINLDDFDVVLVDGNLKGDFNGWDIVPNIVGPTRTIIAISGNSDNNTLMMSLGAAAVAAKPDVTNGVLRILRDMTAAA